MTLLTVAAALLTKPVIATKSSEAQVYMSVACGLELDKIGKCPDNAILQCLDFCPVVNHCSLGSQSLHIHLEIQTRFRQEETRYPLIVAELHALL